jgi:hypothetical protein
MILKSTPEKDKRIPVLIVLLIVLLISNAVTLKFFLDERFSTTEEEYNKACQEEVDSIRYYICDWYAEINHITNTVEVFNNEIRFDGGKYPLTVSENRLRAVFPRGERFFRMNYITHAEFYKDNSHILCRIFYSKGGEFVFRVD